MDVMSNDSEERKGRKEIGKKVGRDGCIGNGRARRKEMIEPKRNDCSKLHDQEERKG